MHVHLYYAIIIGDHLTTNHPNQFQPKEHVLIQQGIALIIRQIILPSNSSQVRLAFGNQKRGSTKKSQRPEPRNAVFFCFHSGFCSLFDRKKGFEKATVCPKVSPSCSKYAPPLLKMRWMILKLSSHSTGPHVSNTFIILDPFWINSWGGLDCPFKKPLHPNIARRGTQTYLSHDFETTRF